MIRTSFEDFIVNFLHLRGIEHFTMGSRRFGYSTESSDLDLCVNITYSDLSSMLESEGIPFTIDPYNIYISVLIRTGNVHLCCAGSHFYAIRSDHEVIEKKILGFSEKERSLLFNVVYHLKSTGFTGSMIYRMLKVL